MEEPQPPQSGNEDSSPEQVLSPQEKLRMLKCPEGPLKLECTPEDPDAPIKPRGPPPLNEDPSVIEERCWKPQRKGDSRKWLIRDGSHKLPKYPLCSTMKATYTYPMSEDQRDMSVGSRRAMLIKKFSEEAAEEIRRERAAAEQITAEYCTEYDGNYNHEGFHVEDEFYTKNVELYEKYPLYASTPASFYQDSAENRRNAVMHGLTDAVDPTRPFRRNSQFTKPMEESFENRFL